MLRRATQVELTQVVSGFHAIGYRGYAKQVKKGGAGGKKGGKPAKEIPKQSYRGMDFSWWKDNKPDKDSIIARAESDTKLMDVSREFAKKIQKGKSRLTRELFTKYVAESLAPHRKPTVELDDEDYEFFYKEE